MAVAKVVQAACQEVDLVDFQELADFLARVDSLARVDPAVQLTMMMDRLWRKLTNGSISIFKYPY